MDHHYAEASAESTLSNSLESSVTVENSRSDADSKLDECVCWTNEKHNSYLDYLENSFVSQLYSWLGGETQRLSKTRDVESNSVKSTDQKVNLEKKHRDSGDKTCTKTYLRNSVENEFLDQGTAEASGQNFREEEEDEKGCDSEVTRKREREANNNDSSLNDQVVPVRTVKARM